ncbi:MAG TPA: hypothetical protein VGK14_13260 [Novimethylophilus sp.]|jgi:hypothetical protein|uniref:hypothetical protein n=1 Tax=Novimethylophilus sp. TaxID=2137426 RepID=UPI002F4075DB
MPIIENTSGPEFDPLYFLDGEGQPLPGEWVEKNERLMRAELFARVLIDRVKDAEAIFPPHDPIANWRFRRTFPASLYHAAKFNKTSFAVGVWASKNTDLELTDAMNAVRASGNRSIFAPKQFWLGVQIGRTDTKISLWAAVELDNGRKIRRGIW